MRGCAGKAARPCRRSGSASRGAHGETNPKLGIRAGHSRRKSTNSSDVTGVLEQKSLAGLAARLPHRLQLALLFNAFATVAKTHLPRHGDNRVAQGAHVGRQMNPTDKALIDLHGFKRQLFEQIEAGVTGTEVIDGNAHADLPQLPHTRGEDLFVVEEQRLGHFQFQHNGRNRQFPSRSGAPGRESLPGAHWPPKH